MTFAWQLPISMQSRRKRSNRAHLLPVSEATNELLPALCGHLFNPGFAEPAKDMPHCFNCERRLRK